MDFDTGSRTLFTELEVHTSSHYLTLAYTRSNQNSWLERNNYCRGGLWAQKN